MKAEKELQVVTLMVEKYCRKKHKSAKHQLCTQCAELLEYAKQRRAKCPHGDDKPFCSNCTIHCYKPEMRQKIQEVMRFSGPRMLFSHPIIALSHVFEVIKCKRQQKKAAKRQNNAKSDG